MNYLLLCNKLSQNIIAKTINIQCHTVSVTQETGEPLSWVPLAQCLFEVAAHLWVRAAVSSRQDWAEGSASKITHVAVTASDPMGFGLLATVPDHLVWTPP